MNHDVIEFYVEMNEKLQRTSLFFFYETRVKVRYEAQKSFISKFSDKRTFSDKGTFSDKQEDIFGQEDIFQTSLQ